jgi:hypothetical protein
MTLSRVRSVSLVEALGSSVNVGGRADESWLLRLERAAALGLRLFQVLNRGEMPVDQGGTGERARRSRIPSKGLWAYNTALHHTVGVRSPLGLDHMADLRRAGIRCVCAALRNKQTLEERPREISVAGYDREPGT